MRRHWHQDHYRLRFSTENWKRPKHEVDAILGLLSDYIDDAVASMEENNIRLVFLGDKSIFPETLQKRSPMWKKMSEQKELLLNIALNYGSRAELAHACNVLIERGASHVTEADVAAALYTAHCPDPDLIVRTGGDIRLSNFFALAGGVCGALFHRYALAGSRSA